MRKKTFLFAVCLIVVYSWSFDARGVETKSSTKSEEPDMEDVDDEDNNEADKISDSKERSSKETINGDSRPSSQQGKDPSPAIAYTISDVKRFNKIGAWISYGVGGLAAIGAAVTGILLLDEYANLEDNCKNKLCTESQWDSLDLAKDLATTTDVLIGIAAAGIITGTVFLLIQPTENARKKTTGLTPILGPRSAGAVVVGEF